MNCSHGTLTRIMIHARAVVTGPGDPQPLIVYNGSRNLGLAHPVTAEPLLQVGVSDLTVAYENLAGKWK